MLVVPVIVTAGLLWASVYNQPFFKECKELEKLLLKKDLSEAKLRILEYYRVLLEYHNNKLFSEITSEDASKAVKEELEKIKDFRE